MHNSKQYNKSDILQLLKRGKMIYLEYIKSSKKKLKNRVKWSFNDAKNENDTRINLLDQSSYHQYRLRIRLENCTRQNPCGSFACAVCKTYNQIGLVEEMFEALSQEVPLLNVTVINPNDLISREQISEFNPTTLLNRLNKQIEPLVKAGVKGYACVEISYRQDLKKFLPHMHLVLANCPQKLFNEQYLPYRKLYKHNAKALNLKIRCVHCEHEKPSPERIRMLAYLCKFSTSGKGKFSRGGFRPPKADHNAHMLFLDSWPLSSVFQGIGLRRKKLIEHSVKIGREKASKLDKEKVYSTESKNLSPESKI